MNPKPYWNPYLAGALLGLALLAAFVVAGQGLGASAFPKRVLAGACDVVAPDWTSGSEAFGKYVKAGSPYRDWLMVEVVGVILGGFIGAVSAGRFKSETVRSPRISVRTRWFFAVAGGILMGFAAGLGRGCTSGQALSGGASLAAGSWVYMLMVFAGGYALARLMRRQWT
ncbi:MAG: YeeE/YedE thiosulfate transporter family protein [Candidatus Delongbacteria bacterium]